MERPLHRPLPGIYAGFSATVISTGQHISLAIREFQHCYKPGCEAPHSIMMRVEQSCMLLQNALGTTYSLLNCRVDRHSHRTFACTAWHENGSCICAPAAHDAIRAAPQELSLCKLVHGRMQVLTGWLCTRREILQETCHPLQQPLHCLQRGQHQPLSKLSNPACLCTLSQHRLQHQSQALSQSLASLSMPGCASLCLWKNVLFVITAAWKGWRAIGTALYYAQCCNDTRWPCC